LKYLFFILLPLMLVTTANAQEIVTAEQYLKTVSERYGGIRDYEARIAIRSGSSEMQGNVSYLSPCFLRIDFTRPADQVIVFNGELLTVYLPEYRAVLNQNITPSRRSSVFRRGRSFAGKFPGPCPAPAELCRFLCKQPRPGAP